MALTGAAFVPALGREALEATSAVLVALDLRLGGWVPNPRYQRWFVDTNTSPRVHGWYLLKELFGRYRPDRDPFVYVSDGGVRESLGLVELLRERPNVAICIHARGGRAGSLYTLADAIELAETELDVRIDLDRGDVGRRGGEVAPESFAIATGTIVYPSMLGGGVGRLLYASADATRAAGHDELVALGEQVGVRLATLFDRVSLDGVNP
jgi:hypothetical protein